MKTSSFENIYDKNSLTVFISESVKFKTSIVAEDEKETGKRAILNLGHTLGHAIESLTNYKKYSHGEYKFRLMKRTNHIFSFISVYCHFAANRRIYTGKQCGRNLYKSNPS